MWEIENKVIKIVIAMEVIIISVAERNTSLLGKNTSLSERYEYSSPVELDSISGNYFAIPASIILDTEINEKRVAVFSYFSSRRGIGCELLFSINNIIKWLGKKPDRHPNGINEKTIQVVEYLNDMGYLTLSEELTSSSYIETVFNLKKISQECDHNRFAIIYLDELKQILNYQNSSSKDSLSNNDAILLVFAYLRMKIYRRKNMLLPEEINVDNKNSHKYDIEARRLRSPDAYDYFYNNIAKELGLSARAVSKSIYALNDLGLIYSESLPRIYYEGKWRTDCTIFCNAYKREGNYLLASGSDYYLTEVQNKKEKIKKKYKI